MSRRRTPKRIPLAPDPIYENQLVQMIVNHLMKKGKKTLAYRLCYQTMTKLEEISQKDPILVLEQAVRNATPQVEVKGSRRGGSIRQVPRPVEGQRGTALAIRWILASCRNRSGRDTVSKLTNELTDASKNMGNAVRKREEVHRMAEANKVFAKR